MKVLIVEDDLNKLEQIKSFIESHYTVAEVTIALSYQSGLNALIAQPPDIVILDMQLPTFDKTPTEDGGRRRSLAGRELLRQLQRRHIGSHAVVVTQLKEFGEEGEKMSLAELRKQLVALNLKNYKGLVYYHPKLTNWKDDLWAILQRIPMKNK